MTATTSGTTGLPTQMLSCCDLDTRTWNLTGAQPARQARQILADQISGHSTDPALAEDLAVMVSEATTNANVHAPGPCELRIITHGGIPLVIEIIDADTRFTEIAVALAARPGPDDLATLLDGGRGLGIIARLSGGRCGVHPTQLTTIPASGKSVWFAIPWPPPT